MTKVWSSALFLVVLASLVALPGVTSAGFEVAVPRAGRAALDVPVAPAGFGADSAEIDHAYLQLSPGDMQAWSGYGSLSGELRLSSAEAIELVNGVQCLRVRDHSYSGGDYLWRDLWLAQDLAGNVWILGLADSNGTFIIYGAATPMPALWVDLLQGDAWDDIATGAAWPHVASGTGEVVSTVASVGTLRMGGGPYSGCLLVRDTASGGLIAEKYYAPDVGLVRITYPNLGSPAGFERVFPGQAQPGPGIVEFGSDTYSAVEEAGTFVVTVVRRGGSQGVAWVEFEITGVTSTFSREGGEASVFMRDHKVVYLAPGQTEVVFDAVVVDNSVWNNKRTGTMEIANPGGGAELGSRTTALVNIQEAEKGEDPGLFIGPCFIGSLAR